MSIHRFIVVLVLLSLLSAPITLGAQPGALVTGNLSLDQLTERADMIVVSTVASRRSRWEHSESSRLIMTTVTLAVEQALKGSAPRTLSVEVYGGTIGDERQYASHVPEFRVGERDVLFLNRPAHALSPLVGSDQGRFRIVNESATGTARVLTAGFTPLVTPGEIGSAGRRPLITALSAALPLSEFVTIIRDRMRILERAR